MSARILTVDRLGKSFRTYAHESRRVLGWLTGAPRGFVDNWVLRDISFDVKPGEGMGILGRNGAGKSTLLKLVAGTSAPTEGSVTLNGRVNVLELGVGFNPEFTGRENVLHSLSMMGHDQREIRDALPSIESFADIGTYFDKPMRVYSSGMYMRVAFAAATIFRPDILIVDEAMSVGDAFFQAKCFERISKLRDAGTALLFVSHSAGDVVKHCERAIFLDQGRLALSGPSREVTNVYLDHLFGKGRQDSVRAAPAGGSSTVTFSGGVEDVYATRPFYRKDEYRWGVGGVRICDYSINSGDQAFPSVFHTHDRLRIAYKVAFDQHVDRPLYGLLIKTLDGLYVYGTNSDLARTKTPAGPAAASTVQIVSFDLPLSLNTGSYLLSVGVTDISSGEPVPLDRRYDSILMPVENSKGATGQLDLDAEFCLHSS